MTKHRSLRSVCSISLIALLLLTLLAPVTSWGGSALAARPALKLNPRQAEAGETVSARGSNFPPRAEGQLVFAADGSVLAPIATDEAGRFDARFVAPDVPSDAYSVVAIVGDVTAEQKLRIKAASGGWSDGNPTKPSDPAPSDPPASDPSSPPSPRIAIDQPQQVAGQSVSIAGQGFPAGTGGSVVWAADGSSLAGFSTDETGSFRVSIEIPRVPAGTYDLLVVAGDVSASAQVVVTAAQAEPATESTSTPIPGEPAGEVVPSKAELAADEPLVTAASESKFIPIADARVSEQSPKRNFGTSPLLRVDGDPGFHQVTYLQFDLTGVSGEITSARLVLRVRAGTKQSPLIAGSASGWSETAITWSSRPELSTAPIDKKSVMKSLTWEEYDVLPLLSGNGVVSFAVFSESTDGIDFSSKEDVGFEPALVLTVDGSTTATPSTPSPSPTATKTAPASPTATPGTKTPAPSATPTKTATSAPLPGDSLSFPIRAAFYYPWFPEAWTQKGAYPYTRYNPTAGFYDGSDPAILAQHIGAMQYGGIQAGIASWWGQGSRTDARISQLLAAANGTGFKWTLYYENESLGNPSASQIENDLTYIRDNYAKNPNYLRVNGKFVVFVYADAGDVCGMADRWKQGNTVDAYIVLKVFPGYKSCASQPASWHQYSPAVAADYQAGYAYAISPGFWQYGLSMRLGRSLSTWQQNVRDMVASGAPWQLVTTFNEWGEGTSVEGAEEWATGSGYGAYLDVLHTNGNGPAPGAGSPTATAPASTPTKTSTPATPMPTKTVTPVTATPTKTATVPSGGNAVVLAAGDIASCNSSGDEATAKLLEANAGTILPLGDLVYDSGTASEFANCYDPSWGKFKSRTRPAVGNHEYLTSGASAYYAYFGASAGDPSKGYYSYDLGTWHVVVLNSNCSKIGGCGAGSPQEKWLRADLAASSSSCTLAYWHYPRYSSGQHGDNTSVQPLWQALYDGGVELALTSHDHTYERFAPMNAAGGADSAYGIRQFVIGTGGKNHYSFGTVNPNSQARNNDTFGVAKFVLRPGGYDWQFLPVAGQTFTDSGSGSCHGRPNGAASTAMTLGATATDGDDPFGGSPVAFVAEARDVADRVWWMVASALIVALVALEYPRFRRLARHSRSA